MVHNQEQAANEYAEQARTLDDLAEQLKAYADSLFDVRGPEEVTWANVAELKHVTDKLCETIDFIRQE